MQNLRDKQGVLYTIMRFSKSGVYLYAFAKQKPALVLLIAG